MCSSNTVTGPVRIRSTLVPPSTRIAEELKWWAPAPLRRLHDRTGIAEHNDHDGSEDTVAGVDADRAAVVGARR